MKIQRGAPAAIAAAWQVVQAIDLARFEALSVDLLSRRAPNH
jgi:hypothetical protein